MTTKITLELSHPDDVLDDLRHTTGSAAKLIADQIQAQLPKTPGPPRFGEPARARCTAPGVSSNLFPRVGVDCRGCSPEWCNWPACKETA